VHNNTKTAKKYGGVLCFEKSSNAQESVFTFTSHEVTWYPMQLCLIEKTFHYKSFSFSGLKIYFLGLKNFQGVCEWLKQKT